MSRKSSRAIALAAFLLLLAPAAPAQKKAAAKKPLKLPPGASVVQSAVVPDCGGIPSGQELLQPSVIDAVNHILDKTLEIVSVSGVQVPVYKSNGTCTPQTYTLRQYVDPVTGKPGFPGPTLRVRRKTAQNPGDRIRILLK